MSLASCATRRVLSSALASGLAAAVSLLVTSGAPRVAAVQQPTFRVEANYVRVDAYVTSGGVPVRDLVREDFDLFEDDVPQKIEAFEHVEIRRPTDASPGREPQSVSDARAMAADPRSRVLVIFLDTAHTDVGGSHRMRAPLLRLLERILAPDDLVAVMTPEMSAADISLARRTETIEGMLSKYWYWGRRDRVSGKDPQEEMYETCYPRSEYGNTAEEMIARRREKQVLDALTDLATVLRALREERKAVLTVSDGWRLFREDRRLAETRQASPHLRPVPGAGPGGLTADTRREIVGIDYAACERDRLNLATLDDYRRFNDLLGLANRGNVSFYTVDPRGLPAFDSSMAETQVTPSGVTQPLPPAQDQARLRERIESLRILAAETDGLAVVNSNDIDAGLKRIADDLTSYYLLGYYSTNGKLDGTFRSISVKVKRPGVEVRARRGYRAATVADLESASARAATEAASAPPSAVQQAIDSLAGGARSDLRIRSAAGWLPASGETAQTRRGWIAVEIDGETIRSMEWTAGAQAELRLVDESGRAIEVLQRAVPAGDRTLVAEFGPADLPAGGYAIRVRLRPSAGGLPLVDAARFEVPAEAPPLGTPRLLRAGPVTGGRFVPTADLRFRRTERVQVEWPLSGEASAPVGELLDRNGRSISVPVVLSQRAGEDGTRWLSAQIALAPLAEGDYAVRLRANWPQGPGSSVAAFRIVP